MGELQTPIFIILKKLIQTKEFLSNVFILLHTVCLLA